jgi:2-dehydropantoate 2-reductase
LHKPADVYFAYVPPSLENSSDTRKSRDKTLPQVRKAWIASSRNLMKTLVRALPLAATGLRYDFLHQMQLEMLAIQAVLGSLSVIFDCRHGDLLYNFPVTELMRGLLDEICNIILKLPELRNDTDRDNAVKFANTFNRVRLESIIVNTAKSTSEEINPMLRDVRKGGRIDIDYINGYFIRRARELGMACPVNTTVVQIVKSKHAIKSKEASGYIPFVRD